MVEGQRALDLLTAKTSAVIRSEEVLGEVCVYLIREQLVEAVTLLRDDPDALYVLPIHVTAVD